MEPIENTNRIGKINSGRWSYSSNGNGAHAERIGAYYVLRRDDGNYNGGNDCDVMILSARDYTLRDIDDMLRSGID